MSARAAVRLETLGFRRVYRYQPGKADWFAAGLPREGKEAHTPRVADVARRDVPTCGVDDRVGAVRDSLGAGDWDVCVVLGEDRVVLGLFDAGTLGGEGGTPVQEVMQPNPVTFRPNIGVGQVPDYLKKQRMPHALVTTSDGVLIGLLRNEELQRRQHDASA